MVGKSDDNDEMLSLWDFRKTYKTWGLAAKRDENLLYDFRKDNRVSLGEIASSMNTSAVVFYVVTTIVTTSLYICIGLWQAKQGR